MAARRHRRNPSLPSAPPKRRFAGQPPTQQQLGSSLARVRKLARELPENERPFDPERAPRWQGSSRDLVVNGEPLLQSGYAYQLDPASGASWSRAKDDYWDTVVITPGTMAPAEFLGKRNIDGARCNVFQSGRHFFAQMEHMSRNGEVDSRDIPAHLNPAEINEIPEQNGDDIGYSQGYSSKKEPGWYQVRYATGSDYSGGSVERSNYKTLAEMLLEHHPRDAEPVVWARTSGGHGTYGIVVRYGELNEEIQEALDALEDYPLLNEEAHSELEMEEQDEAWENWGRSEFVKEVAKIEGKDKSALEDAITADQWHGVFRAMCTSTSRDWEDQGGEGPWIDMKKLADELTGFIETGEFPKYSSDYEDDALQALYDALPTVEEN